MNKFVFIILLSFALLPISGQSQTDWFAQTPGVSSDLYDIEFVSLNTGYAVGVGGKILKTIDGGYSWTQQTSGTTLTLFDCEFESELLGRVCGAGGLVLRTSDGGTTWTPTVILPANEFHAIHFFTTTNGYVAGKNTTTGMAEIYYTTNGGVSFTGIAPPGGMTNIIDLVFANLNQGLVMDQWNLYYTTNAGLAWAPISIATSFARNKVEIFNATNGWMVGDEGSIFFSGSSGTSWTAQNSGVSENLYGISIVDVNTIYVCGEGGLILKSTDGGDNWSIQTSPGSETLKSISAANEMNAWSCGVGPVIWRTETDLDLQIASYDGSSDVCINQPFSVSVTLKNTGNYTVGDGTIAVLENGNTILTYDLNTPIVAGDALVVDLGAHSVISNTTLTITYSGDDITSNNVLVQPINVISELAYGVTGPETSCIGETINLEAFGGNSYYWFNASADSSAQNQAIVFTGSENYIVKITQDDCVVLDTIAVSVGSGSCSTSAFTPNGDGKNDFFYIENLPLGENTVTIYNRWGDEIRIIQNYDNVTIFWNGDDTQNSSVVEGTYFYVVESKTSGAFSEGWVQVLK